MKKFKRLLSSALAIAMVLSTFILIPAVHTHVFAAEGDAAVMYQLNGTTQDAPFEIYYADSVSKIFGGEVNLANMEKFTSIGAEWSTTAGGENFIKTSDGKLVARVWSNNGGGNGGDAQNVGIRFTAPATGTYVFSMMLEGSYVKMAKAEDGADFVTNGAMTNAFTLTKGESIWFYIIGTESGGTSATAKEATFYVTADFYCGTTYSIGRDVTALADEEDPFELLVGGAYEHSTVLETAMTATAATVGTTSADPFYVTNNELVAAPNSTRTTFVKFTAPEAGTYTYIYVANSWNGPGTTRTGVISDAATGIKVSNSTYFFSFEGLMEDSNRTHPFQKFTDGRDPIKTVELEAGETIYFFAMNDNNGSNVTTKVDVIKIGHGETEYETTGTTHTAVCSACKTAQGEAVSHDTEGENGACSVCGFSCDHVGTWTDGACTNCGATEHTCVSTGEAIQEGNGCYKECDVCGERCLELEHTGSVCVQCGWSAAPYVAAIAGDNEQIDIGETFTVTLNMEGVKATYNSFKLVYTYDPEKLEFDQDASTLAADKSPDNLYKTMEVTHDAENGTITISGYGADITADKSFRLVFTALAATEEDQKTAVVLTSAAFSDKVMAETENLEALTDALTEDTAEVAIRGVYTVTEDDENDWVEANKTEVIHGESVTFTVEDKYYDYTVTVLVDGQPVEPTYDDGVYTVSNVTGDVEFSVTARTAHTFGITATYSEHALENMGENQVPSGNATHDTDLTFFVPNNVDPSVDSGWQFTLTVTIGGQTYNPSSTAVEGGKEYTIAGEAITDAVVITVAEEEIENTKVPFEVTAPGCDGEIEAPESPVEKEQPVSITITQDDRYTYEVSATVGGVGVDVTEVDNQDGTFTYTIAGEDVTAGVEMTVVKTLIVGAGNVSISEYLTLDESAVYLIKVTYNTNAKMAAGDYKYDGNAMFWSAEYNAYCYLVFGASAPEAEAVYALITLDEEATATEVLYDGNVNMSSKVDLNDAQLVWNMYNAKMYSDFTENVTVEKFLRADVNGSANVDAQDAVAVVNTINETPQA